MRPNLSNSRPWRARSKSEHHKFIGEDAIALAEMPSMVEKV
jgi:hypothetical protein